jgi:hypothetical protein
VSIAVGGARYRPRQSRRLPVVGAYVSTAALLAIAGFGLGELTTSGRPLSDPIRTVAGIPISTADSPAGALAAADNTVAIGYGSVEQAPGRDAQLITTTYTPAIRASALSGAAEVRAQNPGSGRFWAHGGRNVSLIGGRRLDSYNRAEAQVTTWSADVFWGPDRSPKQAWFLTRTALRWSGDRWLVTGTETSPTPGPVPALTPQAARSNDDRAAFDTGLRGFVQPIYGDAG